MHPRPKRKCQITPEKEAEIRTKASEILERRNFVDPTYDVTFKMLFEDKELLKHLINTLLDLENENEVIEVEFLPQELVANHKMEQKVMFDIRCKTNHDQEIILEMQRQYKKYFIARMQYYMARLVVYDIKAGESDLIHEKLKKTQILVISKDKLINDTEYVQDEVYEQTVMPTVSERGHIEMFQNVMRWKFYELKKFERALESGKIDLESKRAVCEWLNFFNNCANIDYKGGIPEGINSNVKKAYEMMTKVKLEEQGKLQEYLDETVEEMFDRIELEEIEKAAYKKAKLEAEAQKEEELKKACEKSKLEGKIEGRLEGKIEGRFEGKMEGILEGELKGKLDFLQNLIKQGIPHEILVKTSNILTEQQIFDIENYVHEHGISPVEELLGLISEIPASLEHAT